MVEIRVEKQEKLPASEEVTEVAPSILRMQLPIDMPGLGHVNCYALCDERGLAVVDPGLPGEATWIALGHRLAQAGYRYEHIHTVIVTHSHPDHFGGAGIIRNEVGADVLTHEEFRTWMDPAEADDAGPDEIDPDDEEAMEAYYARFRPQQPWTGTAFQPPPGAERSRWVAFRQEAGGRWMQAPTPSITVSDSQRVEFAGREWIAVHTPGHTNDHLCLWSQDDGIVLSGDHVLPTITPHISGLVAGADPLDCFFTSLDRMVDMPGVTLALPAHGHPFTDLAGRAQDIKDHHVERLEMLRGAAAQLGESDVEEFSHHLFQPRSWGPMAESETYAHLEHLRHAGDLDSRRLDDGRLVYRTVAPA